MRVHSQERRAIVRDLLVGFLWQPLDGGPTLLQRFASFSREEQPHAVPGEVQGEAAVSALDAPIDVAACVPVGHFTQMPLRDMGPEISPELAELGQLSGCGRVLYTAIPVVRTF